jgi:hypothetical protein
MYVQIERTQHIVVFIADGLKARSQPTQSMEGGWIGPISL